MSRELERVQKNIAWRMEAITPTYSRPGLKSNFNNIGDSRITAGMTSGLTRGFTVSWTGRQFYEEMLQYPRLFSYNAFIVTVTYERETYTIDVLNEIICNDVDDICRMLSDCTKWIGYSAAYPTVDIGLKDRKVTAADLNLDEQGTYVDFTTNCLVREDG